MNLKSSVNNIIVLCIGLSLSIQAKPILVQENAPFEIFLVPTSEKKIALTFDDGPNEQSSKKILKLLKKYNIKASFFMVAQKIELYPHIAKRIYKEGHDIGNHSLNHKAYTSLSDSEVLLDIGNSQKVFKSVFNFYPLYFRAPFGKLNLRNEAILKNYYKHHIMWTIDSKDWQNLERDTSNYVMENIQPGAILLFHDSDQTSLSELEELIKHLKAEGYHFSTISNLLEEYTVY